MKSVNCIFLNAVSDPYPSCTKKFVTCTAPLPQVVFENTYVIPPSECFTSYREDVKSYKRQGNRSAYVAIIFRNCR